MLFQGNWFFPETFNWLDWFEQQKIIQHIGARYFDSEYYMYPNLNIIIIHHITPVKEATFTVDLASSCRWGSKLTLPPGVNV